jgi:hypothetical protein
MKVSVRQITAYTNNRLMLFMLKSLFILTILMLLSSHAHATDLLSGTDTDIKDTMTGTGRHWAYYIEGAVALGGLIKTRNIFVCFGLIAVAIFINVLLFLVAGH